MNPAKFTVKSNQLSAFILSQENYLAHHVSCIISYIFSGSLIVLLAACGTGQASRVEPTPTALVQTEATPAVPTAAPQTTEEPPASTSEPTLAPTEETVEQGAEPAPSAPEPAESTIEPTEPVLLATDEPLPTLEPEPATADPPEADLPAAAPPTEAPLPLEAPAAAEVPALETVAINLIPVANGLTKPLYLTHAGDGGGRLFVLEQAGRILIVQGGQVNPTPFLDIVSLVGSDANEQGLLGIAFHPQYGENGLFFVNYTDKQGDTIIARYQVSTNPDAADPDSAKILLTIDQPYANHNGGQVVFGPDGYLYIGMGDGGAGGDPHNNGQNVNVLLGKILRLDVDNGDPYGIPADNPFAANGQGSPEIWSYGWRNPWRISFDTATGDMYIADVGQNQYEEIDVELAGTPGGQNYGWRFMEGLHCFDSSGCDAASQGLVLPVAEYDHGQGCSVTGGYVYRGSQFPALTGIYFYGDYCSGIIWGLRHEADGSWSNTELLQSSQTISSFGQDEAGEVYLVQHSTGEIFQLGN
jgi:glucose/arabinose dehydrogenase